MRKIGPIISIIAGSASIIFAIIILLSSEGIISGNSFIGSWTSDIRVFGSASIGVQIGFGAAQIILGIFALGKPRGVSSFILIIIFALSTTLYILSGVYSSEWPLSMIIPLALYGLATAGLIVGFVQGNDNM